MKTTAHKKKEQEKDSVKTLKEFIVKTNKYKYKREKSTTVSKMLLNIIGNSQVYNTVTSELLKEQVVTKNNTQHLVGTK